MPPYPTFLKTDDLAKAFERTVKQADPFKDFGKKIDETVQGLREVSQWRPQNPFDGLGESIQSTMDEIAENARIRRVQQEREEEERRNWQPPEPSNPFESITRNLGGALDSFTDLVKQGNEGDKAVIEAGKKVPVAGGVIEGMERHGKENIPNAIKHIKEPDNLIRAGFAVMNPLAKQALQRALEQALESPEGRGDKNLQHHLDMLKDANVGDIAQMGAQAMNLIPTPLGQASNMIGEGMAGALEDVTGKGMGTSLASMPLGIAAEMALTKGKKVPKGKTGQLGDILRRRMEESDASRVSSPKIDPSYRPEGVPDTPDFVPDDAGGIPPPPGGPPAPPGGPPTPPPPDYTRVPDGTPPVWPPPEGDLKPLPDGGRPDQPEPPFAGNIDLSRYGGLEEAKDQIRTIFREYNDFARERSGVVPIEVTMRVARQVAGLQDWIASIKPQTWDDGTIPQSVRVTALRIATEDRVIPQALGEVRIQRLQSQGIEVPEQLVNFVQRTKEENTRLLATLAQETAESGRTQRMFQEDLGIDTPSGPDIRASIERPPKDAPDTFSGDSPKWEHPTEWVHETVPGAEKATKGAKGETTTVTEVRLPSPASAVVPPSGFKWVPGRRFQFLDVMNKKGTRVDPLLSFKELSTDAIFLRNKMDELIEQGKNVDEGDKSLYHQILRELVERVQLTPHLLDVIDDDALMGFVKGTAKRMETPTIFGDVPYGMVDRTGVGSAKNKADASKELDSTLKTASMGSVEPERFIAPGETAQLGLPAPSTLPEAPRHKAEGWMRLVDDLFRISQQGETQRNAVSNLRAMLDETTDPMERKRIAKLIERWNRSSELQDLNTRISQEPDPGPYYDRQGKRADEPRTRRDELLSRRDAIINSREGYESPLANRILRRIEKIANNPKSPLSPAERSVLMEELKEARRRFSTFTPPTKGDVRREQMRQGRPDVLPSAPLRYGEEQRGSGTTKGPEVPKQEYLDRDVAPTGVPQKGELVHADQKNLQTYTDQWKDLNERYQKATDPETKRLLKKQMDRLRSYMDENPTVQQAGMWVEGAQPRTMPHLLKMTVKDFDKHVSKTLRDSADPSHGGRRAQLIQAWMDTDNITDETARGKARDIIIRSLKRPNWAEKVARYQVAQMISSPWNMLSNTITAAVNTGKTVYDSYLDKGSASAMAALRAGHEAVMEGVAWDAAKRTMKTGISEFQLQEKFPGEQDYSKYLEQTYKGTSTSAYMEGVTHVPESKWGRMLDSPMRLNIATDEYFKQLNLKMALASIGVEEAKRTGRAFEDLIANPTERMWSEAEAITRAANFVGKPSLIARGLGAWRDQIHKDDFKSQAIGLLGYAATPFVRVPEVIAVRGAKFLIAPVTETVQAMGEWGKIIKSEAGSNRQKAAKHTVNAAIATAVNGVIIHQAMEGNITGDGPDNAHERAMLEQSGWKSNSVLVGGKWVPHSFFGPLSMPMAAISNFVEKMKEAQDPNQVPIGDLDKVAGAVKKSIMGMGNATYFKTYVDFADAIKASNSSQITQRAASVVSGYVPFGGAWRGMTSNMMGANLDPFARESDSILSGVAAKHAGPSYLLRKRIESTTGRAAPRDSSLKRGPARNDVAEEIIRLERETGKKINVPFQTRTQLFEGKAQSNDQRDEINRSRGDLVQQYGQEILDSDSYKNLSDDRKFGALNAAMGQVRDQANLELGDKVSRSDESKARREYDSVPHYEGVGGSPEQIRKENFRIAKAKAEVATRLQAVRDENPGKDIDWARNQVYNEMLKDGRSEDVRLARRKPKNSKFLTQQKSKVEDKFGVDLDRSKTSDVTGSGSRILVPLA